MRKDVKFYADLWSILFACCVVKRHIHITKYIKQKIFPVIISAVIPSRKTNQFFALILISYAPAIYGFTWLLFQPRRYSTIFWSLTRWSPQNEMGTSKRIEWKEEDLSTCLNVTKENLLKNEHGYTSRKMSQLE